MESTDQIASEFFRILTSFLQSLSDSFDKCDATRDVLTLVEKLKLSKEFRINTIRKYHAHQSKNYGKKVKDYINSKMDIPVLAKIALGKKYKNSDIDTRDAIEEYVDALNNQSRLFSLVDSLPTTVVGKVDKIKQAFFKSIGLSESDPIDFDKISIGDCMRFLKSQTDSDVAVTQAEMLEVVSVILPHVQSFLPAGVASLLGGGGDPKQLLQLLAAVHSK